MRGHKLFSFDDRNELIHGTSDEALEYRGFRKERCVTFRLKLHALYTLYQKLSLTDEHSRLRMQQEWDQMSRPPYQEVTWSPEQQEAMDFVQNAVCIDDENIKALSKRWLYIEGEPGSGKSRVILGLAIFCAKRGIRVCTTILW